MHSNTYVIQMETSRDKYELINKSLWVMKIPEVGLTIGTIVGFIAAIFGFIDVNIPIATLIARVVLFPIRLCIVNEKRKLEKRVPSLVPKKKEYVFKYG